MKLRGNCWASPTRACVWWDRAQSIIRNRAIGFHRAETCEGYSEVGACIMSSTFHKVSPQGWAYLKDKGPSPMSQAQAYSMLCSFADREWSDRSGLKVIEHLKEVLDDPTEEL